MLAIAYTTSCGLTRRPGGCIVTPMDTISDARQTGGRPVNHAVDTRGGERAPQKGDASRVTDTLATARNAHTTYTYKEQAMKTQDTKNEQNVSRAAMLYDRLAEAASKVSQENAGARAEAVMLAQDLLATGVSLRAAAFAGGHKADTSLDRYMTIARGIAGKVRPPKGFADWDSAIAGLALRPLVAHVREQRGKAGKTPMSIEQRAKRIADAALRNLLSLTVRSKSAKRKGVIIARQSLADYVVAFIAGDFKMEAVKDLSLALVTRKSDVVKEQTPVVAPGVQSGPATPDKIAKNLAAAAAEQNRAA